MKHARPDYDIRVQDSANLIPEDEPVVLLRAQDKLACKAMRYYLELCYNASAIDVARVLEPHVKAMEQWEKKKIPDLPKEDSEVEESDESVPLPSHLDIYP